MSVSRTRRDQIVNRYIKDDEYGYTIIAYPMPEIDPRYEKIFREIVKINTLELRKNTSASSST